MVFGKTFADTLTCVESETPVKTEIDSNAALKPYTEVETLKKDEAVAIVYTRAHMFPQAPDTKKHTGRWMADAPIDAVADTLAELKAETLGDKLANVMSEVLL